MTNEQMWTMWETFRTIVRKSKTKEEIEEEIDRIMDAARNPSKRLNS